MKPNALAQANAKIKSTNKMFDESIDPLALIYLSISDNYGRKMTVPIINNEEFLMTRYKIFKEIMAKPYVSGNDLIKCGIVPDKNFSEYLSYAHKLRLGGINKRDALKQTLAYINKKT